MKMDFQVKHLQTIKYITMINKRFTVLSVQKFAIKWEYLILKIDEQKYKYSQRKILEK